MPFNITERQKQSSLQNIQNRFVRIKLLNYQFQTIDEISGVVTSGNISINANSDIRRTGSLNIVVQDSTFEVGASSKVWLDKYVQVFVDIDHIISGKRVETNCGIFIIDAPKYQFDPSTNTLTLSLLDLMAKLTGIRNGYLKGIPTRFPAGEDIRQAIIGTLGLGGFTKYIVEAPQGNGKIPTDLEFNAGATVYELLTGLRDIYPNYEMFFDIDGTFYYKPIPTGANDPVVIGDDVWESIVTSEGIGTDFQNIKNSIEVYGRTHSPQFYASNVSVSGRNILLTINTSYADGVIYGFSITNTTAIQSPLIKISGATTPSGYLQTITDSYNTVVIPASTTPVYYCVQYVANGMNNSPCFRWLGHVQAYGFAEDTNPNSPFYVNGTVGRIRLPLFGGEYENCISDDLAQQRAEYELWLHTNMKNTVTLQCVPTPWMDVNQLVEYTLQRNGQTNQYLIKSINMGLGATDSMTVEMIQYYPNP